MDLTHPRHARDGGHPTISTKQQLVSRLRGNDGKFEGKRPLFKIE
jgi:hypothetical protein